MTRTANPGKLQRRLNKEDILEKTAPLFAEGGYAATSMRDLAKACGITPAALYHHFEDKDQLYLEALEYIFRRRIGRMSDALKGLTTFEDKVRRVVEVLVDAIHGDELFLTLLRRELLVRDEKRLEYLATRVFAEPFREIMRVGRDLPPGNYRPSFLATSALALTIGHYTLEPVRRYLMPSDTPQDLRQTIIDHVTDLALHGMRKDPR
ncbi:TetR/AcrR family transcriptional regulator [Immundisolibacter sp.]|uniref:TetR/AcrR family transcriptional regulator n=1 Tax=Immundisolibacter sp. TaxID=1934948 RepID=UPI0035630DAB